MINFKTCAENDVHIYDRKSHEPYVRDETKRTFKQYATGQKLLGTINAVQYHMAGREIQSDAVVCNLEDRVDDIVVKRRILELFAAENGDTNWYLRRENLENPGTLDFMMGDVNL